MYKNVISVVLTLLMFIKIVPTNALAIENSSTHNYDSFTVEYNVTDEWENNQNIGIVVTNTSSDPIENWMLSYDFCGDIAGIWNATVETDSNGSKYIKNAGYNNVIETGKSVEFGYTLNNAEGMPDDFTMCQKRKEKEDGYSVSLNVIDSWEDSFQGEIIITNNSDRLIECWELDIDTNFTISEITDSWAAIVSDNGEGKYRLKGTYTNIIYSNSSVALGFIGVKNDEPEVSDYSLTEVTAGDISAANKNDNIKYESDEMYFKDIQGEEDIEYDGNGVFYVRNQALITAKDGVSFAEIENLAESLNASVVGYIGIADEYQIEFNDVKTTEELYVSIDTLQKNSLIEYASLNTAIEVDADYIPSDYDWWDGKKPEYIDWGIKAIKADEAWEYFNKNNPQNKKRELVKIGLIDDMFDESHPDLVFDKIWNNPSVLSTDHGTHVAGIMSALFNNEICDSYGNNTANIAGMCPNSELYGYALIFDGTPIAMIEYKYALAVLIVNNVKVINMSFTTGYNVCYGASHGNYNALKYLSTNAEIMQLFLYKLLYKGYDFVLVTTAGNTNGETFKSNEDLTGYGYSLDATGEFSGGANALYNSFFNYIENEDIKSRIICVGSIGFIGTPEEKKYEVSNFSNIGTRIDVVAPGENIYSTVLGKSYEIKKGTSMAAPYVSGLAGMLFSVNPNLTGEQVKNIIKSTAEGEIYAPSYSGTYRLINAKAAVDKAFSYTESDEYDEKTNSVILGIVEQNNGTAIENATVEIYENTNGVLYKLDRTATTNNLGEYEIILSPGIYQLEFSKEGYLTEKLTIAVTEENTVVRQDVTLRIVVSINGTVTLYNKTTGETKPYEGHGVSIYAVGEDGVTETLVGSAVTDTDGKYEFILGRLGNYKVKFSEEEDKQVPLKITASGEYAVDMQFEYEDEEDPDEGNGGNTDGGETDPDGDDTGDTDDTDDTEPTDITINFTGGEDTGYTGDMTGDLSDGLWIELDNGYFAKLYTSAETGTYRKTLVTYAWGTERHAVHRWVHELRMATYNSSGELVEDKAINYFYDESDINWDDGYERYQYVSLSSCNMNTEGVNITIHTTSFFKAGSNIAGAVVYRKEEWEKDEYKTIGYYKGGKMRGISAQSPF